MKTFLSGSLMFLGTVACFGQVPDSLFQPSVYRNIGPFRGGRSVGSSGVPGDPLTYYMGTTGGGVWKTTDAGQQWKNVSDGFFKTGSVGAVAVAPSDPNTVYVGMGEHAPRGVMTSYGDGVYKSVDAGKTWQYIGLKETRHIARVVIHPANPDIVWVAAQGALHGPNSERGIYKTTDGGKTWKQVLFVNELTGCNELSIDRNDPKVLYASMWEHMRKPWQVISGGPGSALYKSVDGGETWTRIHKGLPEEKGKMAIAVSPANSNRVYALVESDSEAGKGGLFVSNDAGATWNLVSADRRLLQRAWYYIEVFPDPADEQTLYVLSAAMYKSVDGGQTWEEIVSNHSDYHDLWINPQNTANMVVSDDGGAEITFDGGKTWSTQNNMPTAQMYRIAVDHLFPYNIYGGQQDNYSVKIASIGIGSDGIGVEHWSNSAGGESAFLAFDPENPVKVMGGSYLGTIELLDTRAKVASQIMIEPRLYLGKAARDMKFLYNWNAPIVRSVHEPNTYFHASQYLQRTRDEGKSWEVISPDLTRNDDSKQGKGGAPYTNEAVGAENYGTISYVVESPHEAGVMYTGSDDGKVYLTRNNGKTWTDVTPKDLEETLVNAIEVSPHDPGTVYIATTRYKFNDHTPSLFKSTNYGKSWTRISNGIPTGAYTRVVREDTVRRGLLFAGTELGVYMSFNDGKDWQPFQLNLPVVPVTDLAISRGDLVVATQGRSFWIYDDLHLLRQYKPEVSDMVLYTPEEAMHPNWSSSLNGSDPEGTSALAGVNPASGMVIYYQLSEQVNAPLTLTIKDGQGKVVRTFSSEPDSTYVTYEGNPPKEQVLGCQKGLNRLVWDLRHTSLPGIPKAYIEASYKGHKAVPGTYTLELRYGDVVKEASAEVILNPLIPAKKEAYKEVHELMMAAEGNYREMAALTNELYKEKARLEALSATVSEKGAPELVAGLNKAIAELDQWDQLMVQRKTTAYDDAENFENRFTAEYLTLLNQTDSDIPLVTAGTVKVLAELNAEWAKLKAQGEALKYKMLPELNAKLLKSGIGAVQP